MMGIPVNSIELEDNNHPDHDHYKLSGNTGPKRVL